MKALSITIALIGIVSSSQAESLKSQINSVNTAINSAMMKKDIKTFTRIMKEGVTKDFVYIEGGNKMNFDLMVAGMKGGFASFSKMLTSKSEVVKLSEGKNTATSTTKQEMSGVMVAGKDKKRHVMVFSGVSKESYVKQGKAWKMSKMEWVSQKMTLDGKTMDPSKMDGGH